MADAGFELLPGEHPIVPVMIPDAEQAVAMAARLGEAGVYVRAFAYPVVPMGKSRLRVQLSAAHTLDDMDAAAAAFIALAASRGQRSRDGQQRPIRYGISSPIESEVSVRSTPSIARISASMRNRSCASVHTTHTIRS